MKQDLTNQRPFTNICVNGRLQFAGERFVKPILSLGLRSGLMSDTKEKILITALHLFARDGFEAVSVRNIAEELNITKGALYRHYESKRAIFDSIVERMFQIDEKQADKLDVPVKKYEETPEEYEKTSIENIKAFTIDQFKFWIEDDFASNFRKMLSLEQYRNEEMAKLYNECIVSGPVEYMTDLFRELIKKGILKEDNPMQMATEYYAPFFMLISMYDYSGKKEELIELLTNHINRFMERYVIN